MLRQDPTPVRLQPNVMIPMRDGVRLATDLYLPTTGAGPWPVILVRTPYNKASLRQAEQLGKMAAPKVQYYVMGRNEWRSASAWPVPGSRFTNSYLSSDGRANSRFGTGRLVMAAPKAEPPDQYDYDPATPVPSKGGALCCTGTADAPPGAFDQSDVEMRHDVLVYSTPPLERGVEVTGPIEAKLHVPRASDPGGNLQQLLPAVRSESQHRWRQFARHDDGGGADRGLPFGQVPLAPGAAGGALRRSAPSRSGPSVWQRGRNGICISHSGRELVQPGGSRR